MGKVIRGDCLEVLKTFPSNSVDLIYNDPPFFTQKNFGDFKDVWKSRSHYLSWLTKRLVEMRRVMKSTASIYLHCDHHASHYIKVEMDKLFGDMSFRNEIVWCYSGGGVPKNAFARKHDVILFYSKSKDSTFNIQYDSYSDFSLSRLKSGIAPDGKPRDTERGKHMNDWWTDINSLQTWSPERTGYKTQKPEALLERIILASSNKGDVVLDPMCGSGTTCVMAKRLGRKYIGIDISEDAIKVTKSRVYDSSKQTIMEVEE